MVLTMVVEVEHGNGGELPNGLYIIGLRDGAGGQTTNNDVCTIDGCFLSAFPRGWPEAEVHEGRRRKEEMLVVWTTDGCVGWSGRRHYFFFC